jgi:hypothetical protein
MTVLAMQHEGEGRRSGGPPGTGSPAWRWRWPPCGGWALWGWSAAPAAGGDQRQFIKQKKIAES